MKRSIDIMSDGIHIESHIEQVQAIIQNLAIRDKCIPIASIFITDVGYDVGKFNSDTINEHKLCDTIWRYCITYDIDKVFVTYPSYSLYLDGFLLCPGDYSLYRDLSEESEIPYNSSLLSYYEYKNSKLYYKRLFVTSGDDLFNIWDEYDVITQRRKGGYI